MLYSLKEEVALFSVVVFYLIFNDTISIKNRVTR